MFLKVQKEKAVESDWDAWKSTLRGRVYDVMIANKLKSEVINVKWLPFKSTNVDNNNTIFKLLFGRFEPEFGYSLSIVEVQFIKQFSYPAEGGAVIDTDETTRDEESSLSLLSSYRLRYLQKFKIKESLVNMCYIQHQSNMVLIRGKENIISLYDTSMPPDRNDGIEYFEPLLQMEGHESNVELRSKGIRYGLEQP